MQTSCTHSARKSYIYLPDHIKDFLLFGRTVGKDSISYEQKTMTYPKKIKRANTSQYGWSCLVGNISAGTQ